MTFRAMRKTVIIILSLILPAAAFAQGNRNTENAGAAAISEQNMRAHIKYLSSDELMGRGTCQKGMALATDYMAEQFKKNGFAPAGENGTWFQRVPVIKPKISAQTHGKLITSIGATLLQQGTDILIDGDRAKSGTYTLKTVYAGYGIAAPEKSIDSYRGIDVTGKVVLIKAGVPASAGFDRQTARRQGSINGKIALAQRKGAAAAFIIHDPADIRFPWERIRASMANPRPQLAPEKTDHTMFLSGFLKSTALAAALEGTDITYESLSNSAGKDQFTAREIPVTISLNVTTATETFSERNVLGIIPGIIADEYVLVTAHLDAFGISTPVQGDSIYNGAVDNATGSAGLIEIGRAFLNQPEKPKRSIILIALAGEEHFFLGAKTYARSPLYPLDKTLAVVNIDECLNHGKMTEICVFGHERSTMGELAAEIAAEVGLTVAPKSIEKELGLGDPFQLSDQIAFANVGVPGVLLYTGFKHVGKDEGYSKKMFFNFYAKRIHKPFDEYSDDWDMAGIMQIIRFGYRMACRISDGDTFPAWKDGQPFKR